jgi:hypothetical protein
MACPRALHRVSAHLAARSIMRASIDHRGRTSRIVETCIAKRIPTHRASQRILYSAPAPCAWRIAYGAGRIAHRTSLRFALRVSASGTARQCIGASHHAWRVAHIASSRFTSRASASRVAHQRTYDIANKRIAHPQQRIAQQHIAHRASRIAQQRVAQQRIVQRLLAHQHSASASRVTEHVLSRLPAAYQQWQRQQPERQRNRESALQCSVSNGVCTFRPATTTHYCVSDHHRWCVWRVWPRLQDSALRRQQLLEKRSRSRQQEHRVHRLDAADVSPPGWPQSPQPGWRSLRSSQDSSRPATWLETGASNRQLERDNARRAHYVRKTNGARSSFGGPSVGVSTVLNTRACSFPGLARRQPATLVSAARALASGHHNKAAKLHRKHVRYAAPGFVEGEGSEVKGPSPIVACTHACATQQSCQSHSPGQSVLLQHRQGLCAHRPVSTMQLALPDVQRRAKRL